MKSVHALIIAAFLGVLGAVFNYAYLSSRAVRDTTVDFIVVKKGSAVTRGERLSADPASGNIERLSIPENNVGKLKDLAVLWDSRQSVDGVAVWRTLGEGDMLLREDLKTPPPALALDKDESLRYVSVSGAAFVPSHITPGEDWVSFLVPTAPAAGRPTPAGAAPARPAGAADLRPEPDENAATVTGPTRPIGPFKVLSVGNRLGSAKVWSAAKLPQLQENVLGIRVSKKVPGELEKANELAACLQAGGFRQVGIELHSRKMVDAKPVPSPK
jgi:hypothetical protein